MIFYSPEAKRVRKATAEWLAGSLDGASMQLRTEEGMNDIADGTLTAPLLIDESKLSEYDIATLGPNVGSVAVRILKRAGDSFSHTNNLYGSTYQGVVKPGQLLITIVQHDDTVFSLGNFWKERERIADQELNS